MSWTDEQFLECKRCGKNAVSSSVNCNTQEEYSFCTACGTVHNFTLKRDSEGNAILERKEYVIDDKISFIKVDADNKLIESTLIDQNVTNEMIENWGRKDFNAMLSRLEHREIIDNNKYIIGVLTNNDAFTQVYGKIQVDTKNNEKLIFTEYYNYEEINEDGYGVVCICSEKGSSMSTISKDETVESIDEFRRLAVETKGYLTLWDKEKNELVIEHGELYDPELDENTCEGECCPGLANDNEDHTHKEVMEPEEKHECKCEGNCGGNGPCGSKCACNAKANVEKHEWEPTDSQGQSMECVKCGRAVSIYEPEDWDKAHDEECPNK